MDSGPVTGPVLAIAAPQLSARVAALFPPLDDALGEAEDAVARFPGSAVISGADANPANVRDLISQAQIFHFAGHAVTSIDRSGLLLGGAFSATQSDPSFWDARAVESLRLDRCQLAVLSACSTGQFGSRNEPDHLARAFLAAGARRVVASRWPVNSRATRILMAEFYSELSRGKPVAASLQAASASLRKRVETSHPYYWSAFAVFGGS